MNNSFLSTLSPPSGFTIQDTLSINYATSLAYHDIEHVLFVGTYHESIDTKVYAVITATETKKHIYEITEPLRGPNGVTIYKNDLFVATTDSIVLYTDVIKSMKVGPSKPSRILHVLPPQDVNGARYLLQYQQRLYITINAPCNVPCGRFTL